MYAYHKPQEKILEVVDVKFVSTQWTDEIKDCVIRYTNQATDYWNSSYDVESTIYTKEQAQSIIDFLKQHFEIKE
jgi:hypothetical protein